jgi:acetyltransferase
VSRNKPVICVKAGRSDRGARAASSHTGALAGLDVAVDALFRQTGVIRAESVDELFQLALAFTEQPLPAGRRLAVVSNAGGPAILTTDAAIGMGLELADLSEGTLARLREVLPPEASITNPIDMVASASVASYRSVVEAVLADPGVDAAVVINIPLLATSVSDVLGAILEARAPHDKPVFGCFLGTEAEEDLRRLVRRKTPAGGRPVTIFSYPETAVRALRSMQRYAAWRSQPRGEVRTFEVDRGRARAVLGGALRAGRRQLVDREVFEVLAAYGVPVAPWRAARTADEAVAAAHELGLPAVCKLSAAEVVHKTEAGGVHVDLRTEEDVRRAFDALAPALRAAAAHVGAEAPAPAVLVQPMVQGGREVILGMQHDQAFGPLLMFGLGGVYVEVLKDVAFRIHPLTDLDARAMVRGIKGLPILEGTRGAAPVDLPLLEEVLLRLAQLVAEHPEIEAFDVNPFLAAPVGEASLAVDARMGLRL